MVMRIPRRGPSRVERELSGRHAKPVTIISFSIEDAPVPPALSGGNEVPLLVVTSGDPLSDFAEPKDAAAHRKAEQPLIK